MMKNVMIAVDIGASGGRHIAGWLEEGKLNLKEVHRFKNGAEMKDGVLVWDSERLFREIVSGLRAAKEQDLTPQTIAIDTWGVDFALLDENGERIGDTVSYRDGRTQGMDKELQNIVGEDELYARTGIQKQPFNTVYQLLALKKQGKLDAACDMLLLPEYFTYLLTGKRAHEYTNASTTGMLDAKKRDWDWELIEKCGFPKRLFGALQQPGEAVGHLKPELVHELGFDALVLLAPTHDTASAVLAAPIDAGDAYLSSGTWSLLGLELDQPILNEESRAFNMTNEGGAKGTIRYLKNIMGLWMLQELRKENCPDISYGELAKMAEASDDYRGCVDVNDERFLAPKSMTATLRTVLKENEFAAPKDMGEMAACVCHSLAICYRKAVDALEELTGQPIRRLRVVGGGCLNDYLNRLTAAALEREVTAGPVEATVTGNLLSQLWHTGEIKSLEEGRKLVRASFPVRTYLPE